MTLTHRLLVVPLLSTALLAQTEKAPRNETIRREQLRADLFFLAGDSMRGRLTGSHEYELAAGFIASRFERLGLAGGGKDKSFYHRFDLVLSRLDESNRLAVTAGLPARRDLHVMEE